VTLSAVASLGIACDSSSAADHEIVDVAALAGGRGANLSSAELDAHRHVVPSRSADRRIVRYQKAQVRRAAVLEALQRERARREVAEQREAARQHRLAAERAAAAWRSPLTSYEITARFGQTSALWSTTHTGVDLAASSGSPVSPAARGTVIAAGYDGPYGYKVVVQHDDRSTTWYAHLSSISVNVGDRVSNSSTLGTVGSTGNVTGPHLHLELHPGGGSPVDPIAALAARGVRL
jgi:murein DD-endopeptidase MepM/ murein hydrolase activator NlpD